MNKYLIILLVCGMAIAVLRDLKDRKIPNLLTYPMMLIGLIFHFVSGGLNGFSFSVIGLLVGTGLFFIPYLIGGLGAGDAKLMGAAGAILGAKGAIIAAAFAALFGLIYGLLLLIIHIEYTRFLFRRLVITLKTFFFTGHFIFIPHGQDEKTPTLAFALPITLGTICYIYLNLSGSQLIQKLLRIYFII